VRSRLPVAAALLGFLLFPGSAPPAAASPPPAPRPGDGEDPESAFTRGLRLEGVIGDLAGALEAFRAAAASPVPERRAEAILREAGVLRRLRRNEEARTSLQAVLDDPALRDLPGVRPAADRALAELGDPEPPPPVESPEVAELREKQREQERERLRLQRLLDEALRESADVQPLREELARKNGELEDLRRMLRDAERAARGVSGELTEREREERRREDDAARRRLSTEYALLGREQYMAGRFDDARWFLREAVDLDPGNLAARDLLARSSAPYGDREQVVRGILEVVALEQELRAEQVRLESATLVAEGRTLLDTDDAAGALGKFEAALGRIAAHPDLLDRLASVREQAAGLFDEAARRTGSERRAPAPSAAPSEDPRWQEAVRAVLEQAGSAGEAGGAALRLFPLGPFLRAQRESLPPAPESGSRPRLFTLSAEVPPPGLLVRTVLLGAVEPDAWRAPGAVLEGVGSTLVARAGREALKEVETALSGLVAPPTRSLSVRVAAIPCRPATLVELLAGAGRTLEPVGDGAGAVAVLDAAGADAVLAALGGEGRVAAEAWFRVPERRGFTLAALRDGGVAPAGGERGVGLRVEGLAWMLDDGGIAGGALLEATAAGPEGVAEAFGVASRVRQSLARGAALSPGGALLFAGLENPFAAAGGERHLAVLVRFGRVDGAAGTGNEGARVLPLGDLPGRHPDLAGPLSSGDAADARVLRAEAIRGWLAARAPGGTTVTLEGTGLRVQGPPAAAALLAADLDRLRSAAETVAVTVRAYALDLRGEAALVRDLRLSSPSEGSPLRVARLEGEAKKSRRFLLEGSGGRIPLGGEGPVAAAPAQRVTFSRTETSSAAGGERKAALECGVRPWPGDLPGERWLWLDTAVLAAADLAPSTSPAAPVALPADAALLVVGLPNPFADRAERPRLAVWIEAGER